MHNEVLTKKQQELLPLIKLFSKEYVLVGGTAVALHIGHRRSMGKRGTGNIRPLFLEDRSVLIRHSGIVLAGMTTWFTAK